MPEVIDIRSSDDPRDIVHRASQHLAEGQLLLLPTETQYTLVASALQPLAVGRLARISGAPRLELSVRNAEEARDFWNDPPETALKLARRCWPGPVVLALPQHRLGDLYRQLPIEVRSQALYPTGVYFRSPAHPLWPDLQRYVPGPLVCIADQPASATIYRSLEQAPAAWKDAATLVLNDGPCRYGDATTVVRFHDQGWEIESEGVVGSRHVARLAGELYLFVCTGNTCRSPMAEAIFRKLLSQRLQCGEHELEDRGYVIVSAGLSAAIGAPAAREAIDLLAEEGIDLSEHGSQPLTQRLLQQADAVFTMTRQHRHAILSGHPEFENRVQTLAPGADIADPIGGGRDVYRQCKQEIEQHLRGIVDRIVPATSAQGPLP